MQQDWTKFHETVKTLARIFFPTKTSYMLVAKNSPANKVEIFTDVKLNQGLPNRIAKHWHDSHFYGLTNSRTFQVLFNVSFL